MAKIPHISTEKDAVAHARDLINARIATTEAITGIENVFMDDDSWTITFKIMD